MKAHQEISKKKDTCLVNILSGIKKKVQLATTENQQN
jgi:hypothetical protein